MPSYILILNFLGLGWGLAPSKTFVVKYNKKGLSKENADYTFKSKSLVMCSSFALPRNVYYSAAKFSSESYECHFVSEDAILDDKIEDMENSKTFTEMTLRDRNSQEVTTSATTTTTITTKAVSTTTTQETTESSTSGNAESYSGGGGEECEQVDDECETQGEMNIHPTTCSMYLECVNGNWMESPCAQGTHFNQRTNRCDYPAAITAPCSCTDSADGA
ncbi:UNVERIFIED_CONTAM: hypothetical protein RMT77_013518 [Armadillidium vulgare]